MKRIFYSILLLAVSVLLTSCEKEEHLSRPDYSIGSTPAFELISQHPNGWIKKGRFDLGEDQFLEEFEYYENGYIKSAKVYASYPQQHLYMEISRSEDNKPLWSKYYNPEGELWMETEYNNSFPALKKVYSEEGTAIHRYTDGELSSVNFTSADNSSTSTTTFNSAAGTRKVTITRNGQTILEETYPYQEQVGTGIYTSNHVPVANPFGATETSYYNLFQSFTQGPSWQNEADPIAYMFPYRLYEEFYNPGDYFATKFTVSSELYQSVIEQYPVTENGVLIGGGKYEDGYKFFKNKREVRDSLAKVYNENPSLYKLKYGNEFVEKAGYGRIFFVIGAIRNLPTSTNAANKIKDIALRHMNAMLYDTTEITAEEQEILAKVWFEVKFFSTLKEHRDGVVINSAKDYNIALEELNTAELSLIQLKYQSVDKL